jgi:Baculovirus F protein
MKNTYLLLSLMLLSAAPVLTSPEDTGDFGVFRLLGRTISTLGYAHLHLELNLNISLQQTEALCQTLEEAHRIASHHGNHHDVPQFKHYLIQATTCRDSVAKLQGLNTLGLPIQRLSERQKRFLAEILGVGSILLGMYNTAQIADLKDTQANQGKMIDSIVYHMDSLDQRLSTTAEHVNELNQLVANERTRFMELIVAETKSAIISAFMNAALDHNRDIAEVVQTLLLHRLSPNLGTSEAFQRTLSQTNRQAEKKGYRLLINSVADLFQCETSFITRPGAIDIFVHIPMAHKNDDLMLYEQIPIPVQIPNSSSFVSVKPDRNVLAISADGQRYKAMKIADLSRCTHTGQNYLCREENVYRKAESTPITNTKKVVDDEQCLYFLFQQNYAGINLTCPMHIQGPSNSARAITGTKFILTSNPPHMGTISCANGTTSRFSANPVTVLNIPPGCSAETNTHVVTSTLDINAEVKMVAFSWPFPITTLLHQLDLDLLKELQTIHPLEDIPTEASDATAWAQAKKEYHQHKTTSYGTTLAVIILVGLLIIGVGIGLFYCYRRRAQLASTLLTMQDSLRTYNMTPTAPQVAYNPAFHMEGKMQPSDSRDACFTIIQKPSTGINIPRL